MGHPHKQQLWPNCFSLADPRHITQIRDGFVESVAAKLHEPGGSRNLSWCLGEAVVSREFFRQRAV